MFLKNLLCLISLISVCSVAVQSSQSSGGASRARVEQGVAYIKGQDAKRANLFNSNRSNAGILNHTQNIYTLLKDPEKVSLIYGAEPREKEAIFKAIMASAIIHAPETIPAYPAPERVTDDTVIPTDLSELHAGIGFPDLMEFCNPNKKGDNYKPPQGTLDAYNYNQLIKHFDIIRVTTTFSEAIARNIKYGIAIKSGYFNSFHEMLENSGVNHEDFFGWFEEVYHNIYTGVLSAVEVQLAGIRLEYEDNQGIENTKIESNPVIRHEVTQGEKFEVTFMGINFTFNVQKVLGDGTCGSYYPSLF